MTSSYVFFLSSIIVKEKDGSDSLAIQLADEKHWDDLVIIIAVVCSFSLTFFIFNFLVISNKYDLIFKKMKTKGG